MKLTFDNIVDEVVKSRTLSRKEKQVKLNIFIKENSGSNKPELDQEKEILETVKAAKKSFAQKSKEENSL
jgi:hypothetical protein